MEALLKQQWRFSTLYKKLISHPRSMPLACSRVHCLTSSVYSHDREEYVNVNWDELGFKLTPADYMYEMKCTENFNSSQGNLSCYANIQLSPSACILNYGQGLFEGLKAYRREDGRVLLFRPEQNATRMQMGAERLCMPSPSVKQFVDAIKQIVQANKPWVPPSEKGSLYIRPLLMGSGAVLGVGPAPEYTFLIYASPVGNYFQGPLNLIIEDKVHRAIPNGTGGIKTITNYSPVLHSVAQVKARGFSDILYLDAVHRKYIEECSSSNIFILKDNVISTPATHGTILPGITRKSIIEIALGMNLKVVERNIPVDELLEAEEIFCTGTAMVVNPVGSITYKNTRIEFKTGAESLSQKLYETLTGIQKGRIEDKMGWTVMIE